MIDLLRRWYVSALMVLSCGKGQRQARHVVAAEDCKTDYHDPSRNLMESSA